MAILFFVFVRSSSVTLSCAGTLTTRSLYSARRTLPRLSGRFVSNDLISALIEPEVTEPLATDDGVAGLEVSV